jgi:outer membrane lipoprotein-sorting protein
MRMLALLLALVAVPAQAASPEEQGLAIAREADKRDSGYGDWSADVVMALRDASGGEAQRQLRFRALEVPGDGDKSLIIFDRPPDIRDTALLTFTHKTGDDEQWLYLPEVARVKRISAANKSGAFVGSEFAYEDLVSEEVEKYTYKYLRDEPCGPLACFVVERYPVDKRSGYTRQVVWRDQAEYRIQKIEYYDRKASLLKTLTMAGYRQYKLRFWRADTMTMVNHQSGRSTVLTWGNIVFTAGAREADFTPAALSRAR